MTKRSVIRCLLSVVLMAYLAVALVYAHEQSKLDNYKKFVIEIENNGASGFVRPSDIDHELGALRARIQSMPRCSVNTLGIERKILAMDKIERANCMGLNNGQLLLEVTPLVPVARVFDFTAGNSYYINRQGKRMRATNRYRVDVPVVTGYFPDGRNATCVLPVIDYLAADSACQALCSSLKVDANGDIIMVPRIKGHLINLGDSADMASKFARIKDFYRQVLPVKGWEYYDTISVKWRGQVVGKQRNAKARDNSAPILDEDYIDDPGTMEVDTTPSA